jgi:DNA-binding SARP family transcriptional activator
MEFRILGPLEVVDGEDAVRLPGAKERAVLAYLLLRAGRVVTADRLIDELWGEEPPESARKSLQVRVANLRKTLGPACVLTRPSGYLVSVEPDQLDLDRFQRLVEESDGADPTAGAELLREALSLWRGPALADFHNDLWAGAAIARLDELRVLALERRIDADLALGRHAEVIGELVALVDEHPLRERLRGQLMLALYRSGRQAEALDAFQLARRDLVEELGIEPGQALRDLERAILGQDGALELEQPHAQERSILVVSLDSASLEGLVALAEPLARQPARELILVRPGVPRVELGRASSELHGRRDALLGRGIVTRAAAYTSVSPAADILRAASEQDVDLLLINGSRAPLADPVVASVLAAAPCDVAVLVAGEAQPGAVLVPFTGADHDWSAVEIAAWFALAQDVPLCLAGPGAEARDSSRLLADASLAVQRALGVAAEPLLVEPGADDLVRSADNASLVVVGLSDRWQKDGLGPVRSALAEHARPPVLVVRRGLRPGGLAPPESYTRFTWTVMA